MLLQQICRQHPATAWNFGYGCDRTLAGRQLRYIPTISAWQSVRRQAATPPKSSDVILQQ